MSAGLSYDLVLPSVEKPSRYIGRELNLASGGFIEGGFNVVFVFPDLYEIGMSHQGIRLLYDIISRKEGIGTEFVFAPWPDMEKKLRDSGEPLRSLQTRTPVSSFDLVAITIPYELHYTNIITVLELSGISVESSRRKDTEPIVIAGGPCATNPLPVLKALDAVFVGDGEESLPEAVDLLARIKAGNGKREESKKAIATVEGAYVDGISESVVSRKYLLSDGDLPRKPVVPSAGIVHERLSIEILRGCTRGCRFCHAGMTYRPRRERSVDEITDAVCSGLDYSGWEEVSLLSLSTSDYSRFDELVGRIGPELDKRMVSLSLPSLRPETVSSGVLSASATVRKSGFTIAPEAGTERLRRVINKAMTDDEILRACSRIVGAGWQTLKLYFMIGLPTETEEDLDGIVSLVARVMNIPGRRRRFKLNISVSPFVPRVQTPFQWERQASVKEIAAKEEYLAKRIRHRNVQLGMRDPRVSALEGIFARGSSDLWPVIRSAYDKGCRFDAWRDHFRFDLWEEAIEEHGFSVPALLNGFEPGAPLPWDRFGSRVSKEFLLREREKAFAEMTTEDCRTGECTSCGACTGKHDLEAGKGASSEDPVPENDPGPADAAGSPGGDSVPVRYRCIYSKTGLARFLSHRELINILHRALRRSGLPLSFSGGFHPIAKISMGPSLAVGTEGEEEFFDIELVSEAEVIPALFDGLLPEGVEVVSCSGPFTKSRGKLPSEARYHYRLGLEAAVEAASSDSRVAGDTVLPEAGRLWYLGGERDRPPSGGGSNDGIPVKVAPSRYLAEKLLDIFETGCTIVDRKGRERSCIDCGILEEIDEHTLDIYVGTDGSPGIKDILAHMLDEKVAEVVKIRRKKILYLTNGRYIGPGERVLHAGREMV